MGKRRRKNRSAPVAPAGASRHVFTGGLLGHDPGTSWTVGEVGELAALGVDAVYASCIAIADAVARCPWGEWRGNLELPPSRIVRRPMTTRSRRGWAWEVAATLALYNVSPLRIVGGRDGEGVPYSLVPIAPPRISAQGSTVLVDGEPVRSDDMVYVRRAWWPSVSPTMGSLLRLARDTFAAASSAQGYAADWWEQGGAPIVVLSTDQELDDTQAETIATRWRTRRAEGPSYPAVLGKGAKAAPFGADLAGEATAGATDRLIASVARYFRLPPHVINAPTQAGSLTYTNTEHAGLDLVRYTVTAYTEPIGDAITDLLPGGLGAGRECRLDTRVLTQADQLTRYQSWAVAAGGGAWMTADEIREAEGLPPRELPARAPAREGVNV